MASTPMLVVLEEDCHWWFATRTRAILAFLDGYVGTGRNRHVLDVGCGAANMTHHLRHYGEVVGVDNNPRPLIVARQRGLKTYEGTADDLPFGDGVFDLVTLLDTVEHVPDQDCVFEECRRVLVRPGVPAPHSDHAQTDHVPGCKTGGKLLVTVPAFMFLWSQNDEVNHHQRRYTRQELAGKLEQHGFKVLRISYSNFFVFPLAAALILLRRGRAEPKLASPHVDEDAYQVEMEPAPPLLNILLNGIGRIEAAILRYVDLPVGTSIIAIAERR
jgi:ubiquinone/menaquinone biosynthesis C-methylase UbiE